MLSPLPASDCAASSKPLQVRRQLGGVLSSLKDSVEAPDWEAQHVAAQQQQQQPHSSHGALGGWAQQLQLPLPPHLGLGRLPMMLLML